MKLLLPFMLLTFALVLWSCGGDETPKPRGFVRIDFPEPQYIILDTTLPYRFEYSNEATVKMLQRPEHPYWINLVYPRYKATVYLTYNNIEGNMAQMLSDAHDLAYKHISVASDIQTELILKPKNQVYGLYYHIKGDKVASPINFFVTDSLQHFLRASLYFDQLPHNDSLAPVIEGINKDLWVLVNTLTWKDKL